jgi:hypothetical protein
MNRVTIQSSMVGRNPNMNDMPMPAGSAHYKVRLNYQRRQMTVFFSQGPAICRDPDAEGVLECLLMDLVTVECARGFADWCGSLGYPSNRYDDPKGYANARKTYAACQRYAEKLRVLLGDTLEDYLGSLEPERFLKRLCA